MNETPSGWAMSSGAISRAARRPRARAGTRPGSAAGVPTVDRAAVLDLQQLHRVEVDDGVQVADRVGVGVAVRGGADPDVTPADPPAAVALGHQGRAVGPGVDQHQAQVRDAPRAPGPRPAAARGAGSRRTRATRRRSCSGARPRRRGASERPCPRSTTRRRRRPHRRCGSRRRRVARARSARPAGSQTASLGGSWSSIEAQRQPSPTPCSRPSRSRTCRISSADSGSRGCARVAGRGVTA